MSDLIYPVLNGAQMSVERERLETTAIQREASGRELAISQQSAPLYRWRIRYDHLYQDRNSNEAAILAGFHAANRGQFGRFLFADPYDDAVTAQEFALGDATTTAFRLQAAPGGVQSDALGAWPVYWYSRANLLTYSQDWSNAAWTKSATTQTAATVLAPDGTATAYAIIDTAASAQHFVSHAFTGTAAVHTYSVYAKKGATYDEILLWNGSRGAIFDLVTGGVRTITTTSAAISSVGNGWWRCSITDTLTAASYPFGVYMNWGQTYVGGTAVVFLWGAQIETQPAATRYIPTTSAAVTERPQWWPGGAVGWEPVHDPIWLGVTIYKDGVPQAAGTAWTPGAGGVVNFVSTPASGAVLSWSGSFYRRARFAADGLRLTRRTSRIWEAEVDLVSVI